MTKKDIKDMSIEEMELEVGATKSDEIRKMVIDERLHELYKGIGKR